MLEHFFNALMTSYKEQVKRKPFTLNSLSRMQPPQGGALAVKFSQNSLLSAFTAALVVKAEPSLYSVNYEPRDLHKRVFTYLKKRTLLSSVHNALSASK